MAVTSLSANSIKEILFNLKMQLKNKGLASSKGLLKNFLEADRDRSGYLNREEFESLLQKSGIFLSRMDITYLMRYFDKNKDGKISFAEFKEALVPELTERRQKIVEEAWGLLSCDQNPVVVSHLYSRYNVLNHPQVASGERSEQEILNKFLEVFDVDRKGPNGAVTEADFVKAHREISASYPIDEDAFVRMMECVWGIQEPRECSNQDLNQLEILIKEKIRMKMSPTETEEKALVRVFKFMDLDRNNTVSPKEFHEALLRIGVTLAEAQVEAFFGKYDADRNGVLDYSEFAKAVGGNNSHLFNTSTSHAFYR